MSTVAERCAAVDKRWRELDLKQARIVDRKIRQNAYKERRGMLRRARYRNDVGFRLACLLRARLAVALRHQRTEKTCGTLQLASCTLAFLKRHLEGHFKQGMSWENHGKVWEIDQYQAVCSI